MAAGLSKETVLSGAMRPVVAAVAAGFGVATAAEIAGDDFEGALEVAAEGALASGSGLAVTVASATAGAGAGTAAVWGDVTATAGFVAVELLPWK